MIMEEEVKGLIEDIIEIENKKCRALNNSDAAPNETLKILYLKEANDLDRVIIRKREILRIISRD